MGRKKITADQLRAEVNNILQQYADSVDDCLDKEATQYGKIAVRELQDTSPVADGTKQPGRYKKGWAYKKIKRRLGVLVSVYNKTDWPLTHLLERGHALRQGGRSPAIVHIEPVDQEVSTDFVQNVKNRISNIK